MHYVLILFFYQSLLYEKKTTESFKKSVVVAHLFIRCWYTLMYFYTYYV